jgi:hypothetical protein
VIAKKSIYGKVGLYDEDLKWKIDREMWHRLLSHGVKKKFIDRFVSVYRHHDRQVTRDRRRKNPVIINQKFQSITKKRAKGINRRNTLMLDTYNAEMWIEETVGKYG